MLFVHLFVCFAHVSVCPFFLLLGSWLRFVILAHPGLFYQLFIQIVSKTAKIIIVHVHVNKCNKTAFLINRLISYHSWAKTFDQNGPKIKNDQMQHRTIVTSGRKGHFEFFLNHFCLYSCLVPTNILTT